MQYKQFPPNPSLEHLKSQAKQLLKAYKEGSLDARQRIRSFFPNVARRLQAHIEKSDATDTEIQDTAFGLQDAQLVIAREYGLASWTRLKEEGTVSRTGRSINIPPKTSCSRYSALLISPKQIFNA